MVIAILFGWEGIKAIRWARNKDFDGGCCGDCRPKDTTTPADTIPSTEAEKSKELEIEQSPCSSFTQCCGSKKVEPVNGEQA